MVQHINRKFISSTKQDQDSGFFNNLFSFESIKTIIFAIAIALLLRSCIFEPFKIPSGSMKANLLVGDYIFVSKYSYGYGPYSSSVPLHFIQKRIFFSEPKRGDIVVFRSPDDSDPKKFYIKRLIGLPGDRVQLINGIIRINDIQMSQQYISKYEDITIDKFGNKNIVVLDKFVETTPEGREYNVFYDDRYSRTSFPNTTDVYVVPEHYYFFMGDNRNNSIDSRFTKDGMGYIHELRLIGRTDFIIWNSSTSLVDVVFGKEKNNRCFMKLDE